MTSDPVHVARLYDIAAFERPLTPCERMEIGLDAAFDSGHVAALWERAALERPLAERELVEVTFDLAAV
jgi:hypothetical protein